MNNKYEERLGTERMLPLVFKMALPAVAAQFVNLLYNKASTFFVSFMFFPPFLIKMVFCVSLINMYH